MDESLRYEKLDGGVAIVSNTDAPLNRMSLAYIERLGEVVEDIAGDEEIRAFVITADGLDNFSVGMNLKELPKGLEEAGGVDEFFDQRLELIQRIETMGKPSVATLFGHCLGAGLELPLGCTFRLAASEGASIGLPEMHLGVTPAWGGSARLSKTVGRQHALDMILRAKTLSGPEAKAIGLVDEVWPLDELKNRATDLAVELARQPARVVRGVVDALYDCERRTLADLLAAERQALYATLGSDDAREGMLAFLEKRTPVFNRNPGNSPPN